MLLMISAVYFSIIRYSQCFIASSDEAWLVARPNKLVFKGVLLIIH